MLLYTHQINFVAYRYQQSGSRCITCHRCLRSTVTCGKRPTELKWTFEDSLPCCCYAVKINSGTTCSQISQPPFAGKGADMNGLQARHHMAPEQWTCSCAVCVISANKVSLRELSQFIGIKMHCWPGLQSRSLRESDVFGWSRIPINSRSLSRTFLSDSDTGSPIGSFFCITFLTWEFLLKWYNFLWNFCWKREFLLLYNDFHWVLDAIKFLTAKIHSLYLKESELEILERSESGVGNFGKVGVGVWVGCFTSNSATLLLTSGFLEIFAGAHAVNPLCAIRCKS